MLLWLQDVHCEAAVNLRLLRASGSPDFFYIIVAPEPVSNEAVLVTLREQGLCLDRSRLHQAAFFGWLLSLFTNYGESHGSRLHRGCSLSSDLPWYKALGVGIVDSWQRQTSTALGLGMSQVHNKSVFPSI